MSVTATDRPANERRVPGPRGLKLWGLVPQLVSRPHECLLELVRQYGDIVMMSTPVETAVLVANPDYMEHLFHANHKNYDKQTPGGAPCVSSGVTGC